MVKRNQAYIIRMLGNLNGTLMALSVINVNEYFAMNRGIYQESEWLNRIEATNGH